LKEIKKLGRMKKPDIQKFLGPGNEKCWTKYRWYLLQNGIQDLWENSVPIYYYGNKPEIEKQEKLF
jgi:hypothetical protein